jgi:hypothetical protein
MRARIYRNLNKGGLSIKTKVDGKWRVTEYTTQAVLFDCTFRTSKKERERIAAGGHKSVHAWIEGDLISTDFNDFKNSLAPVPYYNPHLTQFFEIDGEAVTKADAVKVYAPKKGVK